MLYRLIGLGLLTLVLFQGCGKTEEAARTLAPLALEGNWLLTITQQREPGDYRDVSTVLLSVKNEAGEYKAELRGSKPALPRATLKSFEVKNDEVHVVLLCDRYTFDFVGTVDGSKIRGTMDQGGFIIEPAALAKTSARNIADALDAELPQNALEHQKLLMDASDPNKEAISLIEHYQPFLKFCESYPESPLSIILSHALVNVLPQKAKSEAEIQEFAEAYLKRAKVWGKRMQVLAQFNLGKSLAREPQFADLGLKYLGEAEAQLDAAKKSDVRQEMDYYRQLAQDAKTHKIAEQAFADVKDGKPKAIEALRKYNEESPFDPVLMYLRAEAARLTGNFDEALKFHARLAVWPKLEPTLRAEPVWQNGDRKLPEGRMLELWVKQHGSETGLADYKQQIYADAIDLVAQRMESPAAGIPGNRVSVMELFTGTNCPPCLGADLATSALEHLYPPSQLIVLRYHLHTNGLDPLTNPRNGERFQNLFGPDFQRKAGTPSVFVNGIAAASSVAGYLDNAPNIGTSLQAELRPFLEENTPLKLDLSAYEHEGEISISAKLKGVSDSQRDKLRVQMFLAEKELDYPAMNGIQKHGMLIRWFVEDGSSFALPSQGDFQYAGKISLRDIRELLDASTRDAARKMPAELTSIPLDLKGLQFVALVEDADTRAILQAALAPVEVFDTKPIEPMPPRPKLPTLEKPTGPKLILPPIVPPPASTPAKAEKSPEGEDR